jgi:hypothetical protein
MAPAGRSKYNAVPTMVDGVRFASKAEARRYAELCLLQKSGDIGGLEVQPQFLLWANSFPLGSAESQSVPVGKYIADFRYYLPDGEMVIEDVKSAPTCTPVYKLKKRIVEVQYGIRITEIRR